MTWVLRLAVLAFVQHVLGERNEAMKTGFKMESTAKMVDNLLAELAQLRRENADLTMKTAHLASELKRMSSSETSPSPMAADSLGESSSETQQVQVQVHGSEVIGEALDFDQTEAIPITEFKKDWAEKGYEVVVLDSLSDFKDHFKEQPWKFPSDQSGPKTDAPQNVGISLPKLTDSTLLYHGGYIQSSKYGAGVSSIDFSRTQDKVTGPCYFTFENAFAAAFYGMNGLPFVRAVDPNDGSMSRIGYFQILELKVSAPDKCMGFVPKWNQLKKIAKGDHEEKKAFINVLCGGGDDCAFIAINWNQGKDGQGLLPYEYRLLPASIERCNISLNNVIAVRGDEEVFAFVQEFGPKFEQATAVFHKLSTLNSAVNFDSARFEQKKAEFDTEYAKLGS